MYEFKTKGVCAGKITFDMEGTKLHDIQFEGGCNGNLKAISTLCEGMEASEAAAKLKGIECGRKGTSCGDQFSLAIQKAIENAAK
ncbi:MAG: TIGR03905 family TSCPD domain-containing protein [Termitinemataceae bacterium]|nr:MAG: TIGR03905 family TSCPD domain-containing protein [Termitinemataceae bacterium]